MCNCLNKFKKRARWALTDTQPWHKPGSVRRNDSPFIWATYPLTQASSPQALVYVVLQPARFTKASRSLWNWWALTSPFHPYLCPETIGGLNFWSTFCCHAFLHNTFLLRSTALFVAWTFLSKRSDEFTWVYIYITNQVTNNFHVKSPFERVV